MLHYGTGYCEKTGRLRINTRSGGLIVRVDAKRRGEFADQGLRLPLAPYSLAP